MPLLAFLRKTFPHCLSFHSRSNGHTGPRSKATLCSVSTYVSMLLWTMSGYETVHSLVTLPVQPSSIYVLSQNICIYRKLRKTFGNWICRQSVNTKRWFTCPYPHYANNQGHNRHNMNTATAKYHWHKFCFLFDQRLWSEELKVFERRCITPRIVGYEDFSIIWWLRLAPFKRINRVDFFLDTPEEGNKSVSWTLFCSSLGFQMLDKVLKPNDY
jgi:hypothetical protein